MNKDIRIDRPKCNGCGECVDNCPGDVLEIIDDVLVASHPEDCHGCHTCEDVCENEAIKVDDDD